MNLNLIDIKTVGAVEYNWIVNIAQQSKSTSFAYSAKCGKHIDDKSMIDAINEFDKYFIKSKSVCISR